MAKKVILISLIMITLTSGLAAHSLGLSVGGSGTAFVAGAALTGQHDSMPIIWTASIAQKDNNIHLGVNADYWILNDNIEQMLNYYIGIGIGAGVVAGADATAVFNGRIPIGLNIFPIDPLEIFIEVAPTIGFGINPIKVPVGPNFDWAVGFRVHF